MATIQGRKDCASARSAAARGSDPLRTWAVEVEDLADGNMTAVYQDGPVPNGMCRSQLPVFQRQPKLGNTAARLAGDQADAAFMCFSDLPAEH